MGDVSDAGAFNVLLSLCAFKSLPCTALLDVATHPYRNISFTNFHFIMLVDLLAC